MPDSERRRLNRLQGNRGPIGRFSTKEKLLRKGLLAEVRGQELPPKDRAKYEEYRRQERAEYEEWLQTISPECREQLERCRSYGLRLTMAQAGKGERPEEPAPEGFMQEPGPGRSPGPGWPKWARP